MNAAIHRDHPDRQVPNHFGSVTLRPAGPFDLRLSLAALASFFPVDGPVPQVLRAAVHVGGCPRIVEIVQSPGVSARVRASATPVLDKTSLRETAKWLLSWELDLDAFYSLVESHPIMRAIVESLHGLKPLRPATLFEMAIIAITEQQLSLAAAYRIRGRLVDRFGVKAGELWLFPSPASLAAASIDNLCLCGLSHRKAEYVVDLAQCVAAGALDFDTLRHQSNEHIRDTLLNRRGFGAWSVDYILARGLGRSDCLPTGDVGLQRVVGSYLAQGRRLTAVQLEEALSPFRPFRALAAFYLAVHWRLRRSTEGKKLATPGELPQAQQL